MDEKKIEELQEEIDKLKNEMNEKYDNINNQVERLGELFFDFVQNQLSKNIAKNEEINYLY